MTFPYHGRELHQFFHLYNLTFLNERCVEVAVAKDWYQRHHGAGRGLEIGNVLAHYGLRWNRRIVDQFETAAFHQRASDVENIDLFDVGGKFDWIVSLSTIEHVGTDFYSTHTGIDALAHLRSLLAPRGRLLVSFPTGVNESLDEAITERRIGATRACTLVHVGESDWIETPQPVVLPYGTGDGNNEVITVRRGDDEQQITVLGSRWASAVWLGEFEPS